MACQIKSSSCASELNTMFMTRPLSFMQSFFHGLRDHFLCCHFIIVREVAISNSVSSMCNLDQMFPLCFGPAQNPTHLVHTPTLTIGSQYWCTKRSCENYIHTPSPPFHRPWKGNYHTSCSSSNAKISAYVDIDS